MVTSKRAESSARDTAEKVEDAATVRPESTARLQEMYMNAAKAQRESAASLRERYDSATSKYRDAVLALQKDLHDRSAQTNKALAESATTTTPPGAANQTYVDAWKGYLDVLGDEWRTAQKTTDEAYRALLADAMQAAGPDDKRLSAAYTRYTDAIQAAWVNGSGPDRVRQAYEKLVARLHDLGQDAAASSTDAYQRYADTVKRVWSQSDVQGRFQEIYQNYVSDLADLYKAAVEDHKRMSVDALKGLQAALEEA